ncbi:hypothetical protein V8J36_01390 [Frigidibacter sp. MR17.14]|uniref:hypothetical protein n=1 Tax=Frigidibacter sp. MR17.14 TaxID=3126509 RepID=UPI003012EE72
MTGTAGGKGSGTSLVTREGMTAMGAGGLPGRPAHPAADRLEEHPIAGGPVVMIGRMVVNAPSMPVVRLVLPSPICGFARIGDVSVPGRSWPGARIIRARRTGAKRKRADGHPVGPFSQKTDRIARSDRIS